MAVSKEGTGIVTERQIFTGVYSGGLISTEDLKRFQEQHKLQEEHNQKTIPEVNQIQISQNSVEAAAKRTIGEKTGKAIHKIGDLIFSEGYSVFVGRKGK